MESSTTAGSSMHKSGYTMPRGDASPWQRGPRQKPNFNKKRPKAGKSGKGFKRQNDGYPKHNGLLHRLSSPPAGALLERIGGLVENDEVASTLSVSDAIDGRVSEALDLQDLSPLSATQHFGTPDSGEAERFLQSVIGPLPAPPSPSSTGHAFSGHEPSLAHVLSADHRPVKVEDTSSSVLPSPTQTVNSLPSSPTLGQSPMMDDRIPSPSTIEQCKKLLVPVILASIQARDPAARLDSEQCLRLLSDDHCRELIRKAKKMRRQLSSVLSQEAPIYQQRSGSLKRDRVHAADAWVRNARTRFDSANSVVLDVSRRDTDVTLVDAIARSRSPPKAPRAMLQASQLNYGSAQDGAPRQYMTASPIIEDSPVSLADLVHKVIQMFPTLKPTSHDTADVETTNVAEEQLTAHQSAPPVQMPSPIQAALPSSADFVSHLPTQPGTWFRQQGRQFADIVDVDVEVSDDMFYLSKERQPSRVRMALRLCSVPVGAMMDIDHGDAPMALPAVIDDAIARRVSQWPTKGKLVVQVNPESERHKTWLPHALESDPVDVTSCIRPGKNVFRFIQLSDLSEFTFVLVASPPPPEEAWRSWDWASLADSRTRSVDDPFAQIQQGIQVTVRS